MNGIIREITIGPCRLIQGDCMDVLPLLAKVDAVVTDPPYGIDIANNPVRQKHEKMDWDVATPSAEFFRNLLTIASEHIIWCGNYFDLPQSQCFLVWDKIQPENFSLSMCEQAWTNLKQPAKLFRRHVVSFHKEHPTQKPLELMEWCLKWIDGNIVIDPFMGSGTTGVACIRTDRQFIGIEKEPKYFDIAVKRIEQAWRLKRSELPINEPIKPRQLDLIMGAD